MRKLWILFVLAQCIIFTTVYTTYAEEIIQVEMLNKLEKERMVYNPTIVEIEVGDTVSWIAESKGHNVQFITAPNDIKFKMNYLEGYTLFIVFNKIIPNVLLINQT